MSIDFNEYRSKYPLMSVSDCMKWHSKLWKEYPEQNHYNKFAVRCLQNVKPESNVLEIGGWRGELAAEVLGRAPQIDKWVNIEICKEAVANPVCKDERYRARVPNRPSWKLPVTRYKPNILVLSHVLEHLSREQAAELLDRAVGRNIESIYIDTPEPGPVDGSTSFHIDCPGSDAYVQMLPFYDVFASEGNARWVQHR